MWSKDKLNARTYTIAVCGDDFLIRKLKICDIQNDVEQDTKKKSCNLISKSLIEPAMSPEEVSSLDCDIYNELQEKILDLNGLSAKGKEAIQGNSGLSQQDC
jgi:hypothetical protein